MLERRTGLPVVIMGRAADNGRSRPHHDGNRNPQGNRKEYVDMIAAVFILQGYLDYLSHQKESQEN